MTARSAPAFAAGVAVGAAIAYAARPARARDNIRQTRADISQIRESLDRHVAWADTVAGRGLA